MAHYYRVDSSGEHTNLQLYSFKQARKYWKKLECDYAQLGQDTVDLRERCVFVLATLGLSISQLLGQNNPNVRKTVPFPMRVFKAFVDKHGLDPSLTAEFQNFNNLYNECRHFGMTTEGKTYDTIDRLGYQDTKEAYDFGLKVWQTVIGVYRKREHSDLEELHLDELDCEW